MVRNLRFILNVLGSQCKVKDTEEEMLRESLSRDGIGPGAKCKRAYPSGSLFFKKLPSAFLASHQPNSL